MVSLKSIGFFAFIYTVLAQGKSSSSVPARCRDGHYFIPTVAVSSGRSRTICKEYGGKLVSVSVVNFELVTSLLYNCAGAQKRAWIREWNGSNYNLDCLALYTGTSKPGGSIDTSCSSKKLPSVCVDPKNSYSSSDAATQSSTSEIDSGTAPASDTVPTSDTASTSDVALTGDTAPASDVAPVSETPTDIDNINASVDAEGVESTSEAESTQELGLDEDFKPEANNLSLEVANSDQSIYL